MSHLADFSSQGYQVERELGQNRAGGRVTYLATSTKTQQHVVIKQFQFAQSGASWSDYDAYEQEIQLLLCLNHSSIPQYLDSFETPSGFCLVQEYKPASSLSASRHFTANLKQTNLSRANLNHTKMHQTDLTNTRMPDGSIHK